MNRLSKELKSTAVKLMPRVVMTIERVDGVENGAYNSVHYEVARFLDTVRRNEGLTTVMSRVDDPDSMRLEIGFTDHESAKAIEDELVKKTSRSCSKNGIKEFHLESGEETKKSSCSFSSSDTSGRIWDALGEMGVVSGGITAGDIRWQSVFFIGPAGSGKTFLRDIRYVRHLDFKIVDPDEIKKMHPEYDPNDPNKVHQWSKELSDAQFRKIVEGGDGAPVIVDGTGRNVGGILKKMTQAKANGYRTYIVYVYVPLEVSIFRNRNRSRFVPEDVILEQSDKIKHNFSILRSKADKAKVVPNFERAELSKAEDDVMVYPVPQKYRPPRPGDPMYGVEAIAASIMGVAEELVR